jgi:hypothetical protein
MNKENKKIVEINKILLQEIKEEEKQQIKESKEPQLGLFRFPELVLNKNNINNPTDINPNACDKNLVMDYDEVNLNSIKENLYDKFYDSIKQIKRHLDDDNLDYYIDDFLWGLESSTVIDIDGEIEKISKFIRESRLSYKRDNKLSKLGI